jgi:hypothetical protein
MDPTYYTLHSQRESEKKFGAGGAVRTLPFWRGACKRNIVCQFGRLLDYVDDVNFKHDLYHPKKIKSINNLCVACAYNFKAIYYMQFSSDKYFSKQYHPG